MKPTVMVKYWQRGYVKWWLRSLSLARVEHSAYTNRVLALGVVTMITR
jgi:hypothetical protein